MAKPQEAVDFADLLQKLPRHVLFGVLLVCSIVPLFLKMEIPTPPDQSSKDLYRTLMGLPEGSTVLLETDWTTSTRGENGGEFEDVIRILAARNIKAAVYSAADPQAPQVAYDAIDNLNRVRKTKGLAPYANWTDYVKVGFFADADATNQAMAQNVHKAFAGKTTMSPDGNMESVFNSPVLSKVQTDSDMSQFILITASSTTTSAIGRLGGKLPMTFLVTGVMGPETLVYYASHQLNGMCDGLKGVNDLEALMQYGLNYPDAASAKIKDSSGVTVPPLNDGITGGRGTAYYSTLQFPLSLLVIAVIIGNLGMVLSKNRRSRA